jgi:dihydrofolate synthase/folylpolyglutamate synthase
VTGRSLAGWLEYIERQHPSAIALGLDRVAEAREALGIELGCPVVTVGGTNGKGSTSAMVSSILGCAGI